MKKLLFPLFMLAMIVTSCEKDPDMNKLDSDYSVYTDYDNSVHFNEFSTYYLPDSILVPDNSLKANYWKDENAQNIISAVAHEMEQKGYERTEDKEKANVGIQLSYAQQRIQMTTGGWYGGWWDAGFWGPYWGGGWYYPYPVTSRRCPMLNTLYISLQSVSLCSLMVLNNGGTGKRLSLMTRQLSPTKCSTLVCAPPEQ